MRESVDIKVKLDSEDGIPIYESVKGMKFGEHLAVTPFLFRYGNSLLRTKRGQWTVTHIPTSMRVGPVMPKKSAILRFHGLLKV